MRDGAWKVIGVVCLMLVVAACGSEPAKTPPQPTAQPSGPAERVAGIEPAMEPIDDEPEPEPEPEPAAEPGSARPVTAPAPKPDVPAAVKPQPKPEPEPRPQPKPEVPERPPVADPKPVDPPKIETPPPAKPELPVSTRPASAASPGVVDPGGVVAVAASKPGMEPIGADKCKLCHKVQHASWAKSAHAKREPPLDCEGCHGPGSEYKKLAVMKDPAQARAAGLVDPDRKFCATCQVSGWTDDMLQRAHAHKP